MPLDGRSPLKPNAIDTDVVHIMNDVIRDSKSVDVTVDGHRFAVSRFGCSDSVLIDDDTGDRASCRIAINGDSEAVDVRCICTVVLDMVNEIASDGDSAFAPLN